MRPLPSWNDGPARQRLLDFVSRVCTAGGPDYVPPAERIAVFDNDGTLWPEQPLLFQFAFLAEQFHLTVPHMGPRKIGPLRRLFARLASLRQRGWQSLRLLFEALRGDISTDEYEAAVRSWIAHAQHPTLERRYTELAYAPMCELLAYLRSQHFKTFIVSGGGLEFMRPWTEAVYGIPPEQVVGSSLRMRYRCLSGKPEIFLLPIPEFLDDGAGKPVGIERFIGRRPILAIGNSDGDYEMLEWVSTGAGPRLAMLLHHDDAAREWAYDRAARFGKLSRALDAAPQQGWQLISMRQDWAQVFSPRAADCAATTTVTATATAQPVATQG